MNIETLNKRLENSNNKLQKLEKKLERIHVALNGGSNPYYYDESDLRHTTREIEEVKESIKKYQIQLNTEINKENAPKIEPLVEFLKQWREKAFEFYAKDSTRMQEAYEIHKAKDEEIDKIDDWKERRVADRAEYARWKKELEKFDSLTVNIHRYAAPFFNEEELNKVLDREVKRKYDDLVNRITKHVGEIKDVSGLWIGNNGSINGKVIGTDKSAVLETIIAGGYNIQCLHYRVIIH